jgi:hypothetical protein
MGKILFHETMAISTSTDSRGGKKNITGQYLVDSKMFLVATA